MKLNIQKAKHYWENRESAKWIKSNNFDKDIFNELKDIYESIKYSKPKYKIINNKTILFFYNDTKDIFDRDITEISALLIDININDRNRLYDTIKMQLKDIFDNQVDIVVSIEDNIISKENILRKNMKKYNNLFLFSIFFILILIGLYFIFWNKKVYNDAYIKKDEIKNTTKKIVSNKPIEKFQKKWKWEEFCKKYNGKIDDKHINSYISKKCKNKDNFKQSFEEYLGSSISQYEDKLNKLFSDKDRMFFGSENE